jgi:type IV pilus assembly protein PilP
VMMEHTCDRSWWRLCTKGVMVVAVLGSLSGCAPEEDDLQAWMDEQTRKTYPSVKKIPAPAEFAPLPYPHASDVDPFNAQKMAQGGAVEVEKSALMAVEQARKKEPLEDFPLDAFTMIGSVRRPNGIYALLRVEGKVYSVTAGSYMGQNYGRIMAITENELVLREVIRNALGTPVERTVTLQLQEAAK